MGDRGMAWTAVAEEIFAVHNKKRSPQDRLQLAREYVADVAQRPEREPAVEAARLHDLLRWLVTEALLPSLKAKASLQWGSTPYLNAVFWQTLREWTEVLVATLAQKTTDEAEETPLLPHLLSALSSAIRQTEAADPGVKLLQAWLIEVASFWRLLPSATHLFSIPTWEQQMQTLPLLLQHAIQDARWTPLVPAYLAQWRSSLPTILSLPQKRHFTEFTKKGLAPLAQLHSRFHASEKEKEAEELVQTCNAILFAEPYLTEWGAYLMRDINKEVDEVKRTEGKEASFGFPRLFFDVAVAQRGEHDSFWSAFLKGFIDARQKHEKRKATSTSHYLECQFALELLDGLRTPKIMANVIRTMSAYQLYEISNDPASRKVALALQHRLQRALDTAQFPFLMALLELDIGLAEPCLSDVLQLLYTSSDDNVATAQQQEVLFRRFVEHSTARRSLPDLLMAFLHLPTSAFRPHQHIVSTLQTSYLAFLPEEQIRVLRILTDFCRAAHLPEKEEHVSLALCFLHVFLEVPMASLRHLMQRDALLATLLDTATTQETWSIEHLAFLRILYLAYHETEVSNIGSWEPLATVGTSRLPELANAYWLEATRQGKRKATEDVIASPVQKRHRTERSLLLHHAFEEESVLLSQLTTTTTKNPKKLPTDANALHTEGYQALALACQRDPTLLPFWIETATTDNWLTLTTLLLHVPTPLLERQIDLPLLWETCLARWPLLIEKKEELKTLLAAMSRIVSSCSAALLLQLVGGGNASSTTGHDVMLIEMLSGPHQAHFVRYTQAVHLGLHRHAKPVARAFLLSLLKAVPLHVLLQLHRYDPSLFRGKQYTTDETAFFAAQLTSLLTSASDDVLSRALHLYADLVEDFHSSSSKEVNALGKEEAEDTDEEDEEDDSEGEDGDHLEEEEDEDLGKDSQMVDISQRYKMSDEDRALLTKRILSPTFPVACFSQVLPFLALDSAWLPTVLKYVISRREYNDTACHDVFLNEVIDVAHALALYFQKSHLTIEDYETILRTVATPDCDHLIQLLMLYGIVKGARSATLRSLSSQITPWIITLLDGRSSQFVVIVIEAFILNAFITRKSLRMTLTLSNVFLSALFRHQGVHRRSPAYLFNLTQATRELFQKTLFVTRIDLIRGCCTYRPFLSVQWMCFLLAIMQDLLHLFRRRSADAQHPVQRATKTPGQRRATAMIDGTGGDPLLWSAPDDTIDWSTMPHIVFAALHPNDSASTRTMLMQPLFAFTRTLQGLRKGPMLKAFAKQCPILLHEYLIVQASARPLRQEATKTMQHGMGYLLDKIDTHVLEHTKVVLGSLKEGHPVAQRAIFQQLLEWWEAQWRYKGLA